MALLRFKHRAAGLLARDHLCGLGRRWSHWPGVGAIRPAILRKGEKELFIDSLLVRIHLIIERKGRNPVHQASAHKAAASIAVGDL